jgi:hypothetical protein
VSTYGAVDIVTPCWGIDTAIAGALTDEQLEEMFRTPLGTTGETPKALCGYVPLPGAVPSKWDMTGPRLRVACDIGWVVWLVQHCRGGSWVASEEQGAADGQHAAEYAAAQGYPDDAHLGADDEAVRNPGPDAFRHFTAWCSKPRNPLLYEGFAPGMTPGQLYEIPTVKAYWGAYGPWNVTRRGVLARQGRTIMHCGIPVDPDRIAPDNLGGVLRCMGRLPEAA